MSAVVSSSLSQNTTSEINIFCHKWQFQNQIPFTTLSLLSFHPKQQWNAKLFISLIVNYPTRVTNPTSLFWVALELAMVSPGIILLQENPCCCKTGTDNAILFDSSWPSHQKGKELFCAYLSISRNTKQIQLRDTTKILPNLHCFTSACSMLTRSSEHLRGQMNKKWPSRKKHFFSSL